VSLSLTVFQISILENIGGYLTHYAYAYILGPLVGGLLAGIFSKYHSPVHQDTEKITGDQEETENLINNTAGIV